MGERAVPQGRTSRRVGGIGYGKKLRSKYSGKVVMQNGTWYRIVRKVNTRIECDRYTYWCFPVGDGEGGLFALRFERSKLEQSTTETP